MQTKNRVSVHLTRIKISTQHSWAIQSVLNSGRQQQCRHLTGFPGAFSGPFQGRASAINSPGPPLPSSSKLSKARMLSPLAWTNQRRPWRVCSGAKGEVAAPAKRRLTQPELIEACGKKKKRAEKSLATGGAGGSQGCRQGKAVRLEHMQILVDANTIR